LQLTDLADRFDREAREIESQNQPAQQDGVVAANAKVVRS
jgi:cell division protein ZapA (FtsZ GTPase activity inhibitor)